MKLSVIIVSFNTKDLMIQTLDSLKLSLEHGAKVIFDFKYEVIVVDNASVDGVTKDIKTAYSWVKLIESKGNLGFSKANNLGVRKSNKAFEYVLFLNNDVKLNKDTIYKACKYIESNNKENIGVLTCRVDLWIGGIDIDCHRAFPSVYNSFCYFSGLEKVLGKALPVFFGRYHMLYKDLSTTHEIDVCLGAFMLVPRNVGNRINWWPEEYFLNGEDVDFCYQIKRILGLKIIYYPETSIIHYKGASKGTKGTSRAFTTASKKTKLKQISSGLNAMKVFYNKYYAPTNPFVINYLVYLGIYFLSLKRKLLRRE